MDQIDEWFILGQVFIDLEVPEHQSHIEVIKWSLKFTNSIKFQISFSSYVGFHIIWLF